MKITKKILAAGLSALAFCAFTGCSGEDNPGSGPRPNERPSWLYEDAEYPFVAENALGEIGENLVDNGNADGGKGESSTGAEAGVSVEAVDGGVDGSKCWRVTQAGGENTWQEFNFDLTPYYGQGKSYLVSFKLKADPSATAEGYASSGETLDLSYSLYNGAVKNWAEKRGVEHYEYDDSDSSIVGPWGGEFSSDIDTFGEIEEGFEFSGAAVATDNWVEYNYVIDTQNIEKKVDNTGVYWFGIAMSMGPEGSGKYSYLLDDIVIKDLNEELERLGQTAFRPVVEDPEEGEEEE